MITCMKVQFSVSLCNLADIVHSAFFSVIFGPFSAKLTRLKSIRLRHIEFTSLIKFSKFCTYKHYLHKRSSYIVVNSCYLVKSCYLALKEGLRREPIDKNWEPLILFAGIKMTSLYEILQYFYRHPLERIFLVKIPSFCSKME